MNRPVTLVTGASSGIGAALAVRIARVEGHAVGLAARRLGELRRVAERIRREGGTAGAFRCDVQDRRSVHAAVRACERALGPVTRLVANAGVGGNTSARGFDAREVERIFRTNVFGAAYAIEAVLPGMLLRGSGEIVGISSLAGYRGVPKAGGYNASKAALSVLLESLRIELRSSGVTVTDIRPGFIRTALTDRNRFPMPFLLELDDAVGRIHRAILAKRRIAAFPWPLATAVRLGRLLPSFAYDAITSRVRYDKAP